MITHIDHVTGEIVFEQTVSAGAELDIPSLVTGTVGTVTDQSIQIKVAKTLEIEILEKTSGRIGAPVVITDSSHAVLLSLPQVQGMIVISKEFNDYVVSKLEALQVAALISSTKPNTKATSFTLANPTSFDAIVDFCPTAMYADPSQSRLIFYK